jgi:hypothetical protein
LGLAIGALVLLVAVEFGIDGVRAVFRRRGRGRSAKPGRDADRSIAAIMQVRFGRVAGRDICM